MLLISTTAKPATDLGYLLHKNPGRIHRKAMSFGECIVAFPEVTEERTTAALLLDVDSVRLVRSGPDVRGSLDQYVNDRPYVSTSYVSVALIEMFGTAINARCKERPEMVEQPIPLEIRIPTLACKLGEPIVRRLFEPLGYTVEAKPLPMGGKLKELETSPHLDVTLTNTIPLYEALRHLYLLIPVLDAKKHYYLDKTEVEKIMSKGASWLGSHPEKNWILKASLGRKPSLLREALEQLSNLESALRDDAIEAEETVPEVVAPSVERRKSLHEQRHEQVVEIVRELRPDSVIDLGCGDGKLLEKLVPIQGLRRIVGMDVSFYDLEKAQRRLHLEEAGLARRERIELIHGSLMYRDDRLKGFDVGTVVEVIEHLDPPRLQAFERVVFRFAKPQVVIVTTPNKEYNSVYEMKEELRHVDHRFEWTRAEFLAWAERVAESHGYSVEIEQVGDVHDDLGGPSQMAVFKR